MSLPTYRLTKTARGHLEKILRDTARKWGYEQAASYRRALSEGFRYIAENHQNFNSPHREELAEGTDFSIHLVEHHYVSFRVHDAGSVIIAGIFHEKMNIPARLRELQSMSRHEIATVEDQIERERVSTSKPPGHDIAD